MGDSLFSRGARSDVEGSMTVRHQPLENREDPEDEVGVLLVKRHLLS